MSDRPAAARPAAWRFALAAVGTGAAAGVVGIVMVWLLHAVEHLAFGYTEDTFLVGVRNSASARRVLAPAVAGIAVGIGWWSQRRWLRGNVSVTHALTEAEPRLPVVATTTDAVLQICAVGSGASLGREGAPRQIGAAAAALLAERLGLDADQRRILLACGAGAGLAAVYNVPVSGALFTLEILLRRYDLRAVAPAAVTSAVATVVATAALGPSATYRFPAVPLNGTLLVTALLIALPAAVLGRAFRSVMTWSRTHAPAGKRTVVLIPVVFAALGAVGIPHPEILGNGKSLAQVAFFAGTGTVTATALAGLKLVATAACLRAGAIGGLLTPSFATGAAFGLAFAAPAAAVAPGVPAPAVALLGAAAVLGVAQRAPVTAVALAMEFTAAGLALLPAVLVAVGIAHAAQHPIGAVSGRLRRAIGRRREPAVTLPVRPTPTRRAEPARNRRR